jgi:N-acyl-D-amino-acid deacylase
VRQNRRLPVPKSILLPSIVVRCAGLAGLLVAAFHPAPAVTASPRPAPAVAPAAPAVAPKGSILIAGALVLDGTGAPARAADVLIQGDAIAAVGALDPLSGETHVDGRGLVLAPGFIDTHSHGDDDIFDHADALAAVSQGITTIVVGQDGGSPYPLADFFGRLDRSPAAINVASYAGHGTLRDLVTGKDFKRPLTRAETRKIGKLLEQEMKAGALGLATGLEYDPGIYSTADEVVGLAKIARAHDGRYISHIRSEDRFFWPAVDEIIAIGRQARIPVQISHTKLAMKNLWGQADRLIQRLDAARAEGIDITGDMYPYLYWQSTLTVLFPKRDFHDRAEAELVLAEITPPDGLLLTRFDPDPSYAGRTVAEIARLRSNDPATTLMALIDESLALEKKTGKETESVIGTSMSEPDVERLMTWPHMNFCTDGSLDGSHPRGFGSYPRILGRYVRERGVLPIEQAIHRMTGLAADHMGFADRGRIAPGQRADLVLFDPATTIDRATPLDPKAVSTGIARVFVNGVTVFENGRTTGARPGRALRRGGRPA